MREELRPRELATSNDLNRIEVNVNVKIEQSKNSILLWVCGVMLAQTSFICGFFGEALDLF